MRDSLASELRQINRQPDNPAQQKWQPYGCTECPTVPSHREKGQWDRWDSQRSKTDGTVCRTRKRGGQGMNKWPAHTCLKRNGSACRINDRASRSRFTVLFQSVPLSRSSYPGQRDSMGQTVPDQADFGKPSKVIL